ncbi:MAG: trigger factor [Zetaproteobacteria bacterium CG12_big_fil_rev_8_21_14_0_65_54_13]|nr:MAG: trigger factor [Zetaproteobacteria bacterium CG12_big_fil_rev_8_21_14_0_65_54_13]PIX54043.1 MAG: trigger factor [Zetaproteobacteria bacterium CG_4_10_14_3_um_filter_54_28]PJA30480.1 MAG: trigger factor [Zetaproteobacteria bacterium CG_4_9_14_3_um_filter_54_145]
MIQTEVKTLAPNEFQVHVTVAQGEYDRVYAAMTSKLSMQAKLPGFRPGKTPLNVLQQKFGPKLHEDTVSELIQTHYVAAIEKSGLIPALQPLLDVPAVQPVSGFEFTMKVTTWPDVELKPLAKLAFDEVTVDVEDADVQAVIDRLQKSQVKFEVEAGRAAEKGDQLHIDFCGSIDNEEFEGGKGEDVPLVLGEGRFIPGFEEQLLGKAAGDDVTIEVTFPADYQAAHLAGKAASFATTVKSVGKPVVAENEDDLAVMLGFENAAALRADAVARLQDEATEASFASTREAALDALLTANELNLPEGLIEEDMRATTRRVLENMKQQGMQADPAMLDNDEFRAEVRGRSEKGLKLSVLLQTVREAADLSVDSAAIDAEIDRQSTQYPEEQRDQFKAWVRGQDEQMAAVRERLLERACVEYIIAEAATGKVNKPLSVWQNEQEEQ